MKSEYNIDWVIPKLKNRNGLWRVASNITMVAVGIFSKIIIGWFNKAKFYNTNTFMKAIERPKHIPLITVSNHDSCFDDPGIWAAFSWRNIFLAKQARWSLAANDICFTNSLCAHFFTLGQCIPTIRGNGVYQDAVKFSVELLSQGHWLHLFPEGRVNMTKEYIRLKWGVGQMIYKAPVTPIIIPICHVGMETILANEPPYYLRTGRKVTYNFGEPIELESLVNKLRNSGASDEDARKAITDKIEKELYRLKQDTELLHKKFNS
ncbi:tafazzin [Daktulosphaira vitifoliae]|uniref:tafazzin n=1 Tax=Daktulosphaira vitifoliae TaxID=58002 RepID=UPI0021A9A90D|nr:tafazzin [Daktulosphaira vitifoliae]